MIKIETRKLEITEGWYRDRTKVVNRGVVECWVPSSHVIGLIQGKIEADPKLFPPDVRVVHGEWDERAKAFRLTLESSGYPITAQGASPMAIALRWKKVSEDAEPR